MGALALTVLATSCQPPGARGASDATAPARKIAWPRADQNDPEATRWLSPAARNTVALAPVPVLVPGDANYLYEARVAVQERSYSLRAGSTDSKAEVMGADAEAHAGGVQVDVRGSIEPGDYPNGPTANCAVRGLPAVCSDESPNGRRMKWIERGVAYSVTFYCNNGVGDQRCAPEELLRQAWLMKFVGGSGGGNQEAR